MNGSARVDADRHHADDLAELQRLLEASERSAGDALRETFALDELELKRELSDICHRTGVPDWQSLVKTILDWIAEASGAERPRRIEALNRLIEEIKVQASRLERLRSPQEQKQADEARQQIHQLLKSFVDAFSVKSEVRRSA